MARLVVLVESMGGEQDSDVIMEEVLAATLLPSGKMHWRLSKMKLTVSWRRTVSWQEQSIA